MQNKALVKDYLLRSEHRIAAIAVLLERQSYADVVRESQEVVELALRALLRHCKIEVPRMHDVGAIIKENKKLIPKNLQIHIEQMARISHQLRRDRELSFYGSEDLTPSEFYQVEDAKEAYDHAQWIVSLLNANIK